MSSLQFDQFLKKNSRFYLHTARTRALEAVTGTAPLLESLQKEYAPFRTELAESPLAPHLPEEASALYSQWTWDDPDVRTLSMRATDVDLNVLLDEAAWTNDLVGDSVVLLQDVEREPETDDAGLILVGLNILILEQKWDHLNDAFVINVAHELRTSYELFVDKVSTRRGKAFSSVELSHQLIGKLNAAVFLAAAFHRSLLEAINELTLFHVPDSKLRPRSRFEDPETHQLAGEYYRPEFLDAQLAKVAQLEGLLKDYAPKIAARFTPDLWQEDGEPQRLPLLLAQLWDDRGLLSRVPYDDLYRLCNNQGFLVEKAKNQLLQARVWLEGLVKVRKMATFSAVANHVQNTCLALNFDAVPPHPEGTTFRIADYERLIEEKKATVNVQLVALHGEVGKLGVDYSNILDPTIEELIACQPEGASLTVEAARGLIHLAHKGGTFYAPIKKHYDHMARECRYLKELFPFHEEALDACRDLIAKKSYRELADLHEELQRRFHDLDYAALDAAVAKWKTLLEEHQALRDSFATFETGSQSPDLDSDRLASLRNSLGEWEALLNTQRSALSQEPKGDARKEIEALLADIEPRLAVVRVRLESRPEPQSDTQSAPQ